MATTFGCPFEGFQQPERIYAFAQRLADLGIGGIALADTVGMGNPKQIGDISREVVRRLPSVELALHLHNTRGMGLANVVAGLDAGITHYESSLGGLGGCPFAPGATGNICTEDLVHMLESMGHDTGVDLDSLIRAARGLPDLVGHDVPGQVMKAGKSTDLHPLPAETR
jgi:hydroxymethylglutaryl-CoA lyase